VARNCGQFSDIGSGMAAPSLRRSVEESSPSLALSRSDR
jgi:hypothetical protein